MDPGRCTWRYARNGWREGLCGDNRSSFDCFRHITVLNRVTDLQYSVSASGIPNNFFALHKYPGSRVASRHRVETENVSHERLYPNTCSKKSDAPVHFLVRKYSCAVFNSISFVMWSSRTIRSVLSPTTVTHLKYSAAAKRAVSMIKQSALSLALTCSIPGILASFNAIKSTKLCFLSLLERN